MSETTKLRETICLLAKSMYDRGLTAGSSGNISARLSDGRLLVTPTGSCFGRLDPQRLSLFDQEGRLLDGDPPTKEMPLHTALRNPWCPRAGRRTFAFLSFGRLVTFARYRSRQYAAAFDPYSIIKLGRVKMLPYFMPGIRRSGRRSRGWRESAVL
ncbi:aldolase [Ochrobactrum pseudogrignonense]|nr:aldolase [Brucella pseudogrignonensis]